jgi:hypothetical protein
MSIEDSSQREPVRTDPGIAARFSRWLRGLELTIEDMYTKSWCKTQMVIGPVKPGDPPHGDGERR